ncbi:transcription termination/antitermination protein NusG [Mycoplasma sp. CSL10166]|uniref:transcription termination/antitermination protein NusG n=1 Tax=Mycoplasma sp. CSL10166 TaxID=2813825 RepID=UPI00197CA693|nr:transcription termination/antitermination protein NusG [Mycoplasma sp. CSL10166]MBN4084296.1 transcription termination/antitermination protein NusG [Mycoplasma sp. CSL10166]
MKEMKWYMISTMRGKEEQVVEALNNRIIAEDLKEYFDQEIGETGAFRIFKKPSLSQKEYQKKLNGLDYKINYINLYPGYIFARMHMTDAAWFLVRNTQYVTGLVGSSRKGAKPTPVSNIEIKRMFKREQEAIKSFEDGEDVFGLISGDIVEIISGPYIGQIATVIKVDKKGKEATVVFEKFGKNTELIIEIDSLRLSEDN